MLELLCKCPNLDCNRAFFARYQTEFDTGNYYLHETNIGEIEGIQFSKHINNISPNFVNIYNQAHFAEKHNLLEICGVGYRKGLEFLIKDYVITKNPNNE